MSSRILNTASTAQKTSILSDIEQIRQRVAKMLRGDVKFLDANTKQVTEAMRCLQDAHGLLSTGLIPSNQE